jgi:hypothetical protein
MRTLTARPPCEVRLRVERNRARCLAEFEFGILFVLILNQRIVRYLSVTALPAGRRRIHVDVHNLVFRQLGVDFSHERLEARKDLLGCFAGIDMSTACVPSLP